MSFTITGFRIFVLTLIQLPMKKIAALFLLIAFAAQVFCRGIVILNFYINQFSIAAQQCENRYRPMLHCNGKCQLAKKLKQQEKRNEQNPECKLANKNEIVSSRSFFSSLQSIPSIVYTDHIISSDTRTIDRSFPFFHPPSA